MGETKYSARIKAVGEKISESKWTGVFFKTDAEQILEAVTDDDITSSTVTLRWPAGTAVTAIAISGGLEKPYLVCRRNSSGHCNYHRFNL
jgi:hypothetical protein